MSCAECKREKRIKARGLCGACYNRQQFAKNPESHARARAANRRWRAEHRERTNFLNRRWRAQNKERDVEAQRARNRKHVLAQYGLSPADYADLLESQHGTCAICKGKPEGNLHIDHCHETGRVRGLLCGSCNRAIGLLREDQALLAAAAEYLRDR